MITIPNYQVIEQIYESANSQVYRGIRTKDNQSVILKVLQEDYPTPEVLTRYRQEFEITKNLDIAGAVKAYALEKYQNTLVMVLEDFGGESLRQLLTKDASIGKGLGGILKFLPLGIQIADSLGHIHAANIIHKDINPTNLVFNTTSKQIKIIDFGISSRLPRETLTFKNPTQLEGTLAYISPEQTGRMNRAVDYRTDLYSLGVTFYELLAGELPFEATEALELVHCHIAKNPVHICEINADVPPVLSQIVRKLMAKNVEDRYQSAFGLKQDLEKCLETIQGLGNLEGFAFELAQHDFSGRFQIPQKLYGREAEIDTLLQAFERVSSGASEMMLVAGYSGVGKSALVQEVHKPITEKRGYFAAGKFDQYHRNIPYSAFSAALNEFCHYLLTESTEQLNDWRDTILTAVGNNGQVLIEVIPDLALIIGEQSPVAQVGPTEAQNRFNRVFQQFIHAISQPTHPLVLFIDDWQWADSGSLSLLETLMTDKENQYLLIIGAYRDNEVNAAHPFMITVEEIKKAQATLNTIQLANLSDGDVNTLISETLTCEPAHAHRLTELVYQKTHGNAFFTLEFLKSLFQEELLVFEVNALRWQWDDSKIAAKGLTDNVVELMAGKINQLPVETIETLKLAACIGSSFDLETLAIIYQQKPQTTLQHLWKAIEESLLFPLDDKYKLVGIVETTQINSHFKFQHDRVQQAAYSLITDTDKQTIHLKIGRLLLANTSEEELEDNLFDVVNHLNEGRELIKELAEKQKLAELNLSAGKKAKASAAYQPAFKSLQIGIELLEKDSWQTQYNLTLALYEQAAEVAYICTDFEETERLAKVVLQQANTVLDKVKVYESQMQAYTAQNQLLKVVETMRVVLKLLGIHFPEKPTELDIQRGLEKTLSLLGDRPIEDLIELPEMTDPDKLAAMRILSSAFNTAALAVPNLLPLLTFELINLSIKYGNAPTSAYGYATSGLIFCGMEDIETGFKFSQLALKVLERFNALDLKAKVFNMVSYGAKPWKEHVRDTLKPFLEAYQSGLETGDLEIAAQSASDYLLHAYFVGKELTALQKETVTYTEAIKQLKQENVTFYGQVIQQVILNLTGHSENPCEFNGEAYNEITMLSFFKDDKLGFFFFYLHKLILCYQFQDYLAALENTKKAEPYLEIMGGTFYMAVFYFYESLAQLVVFLDGTDTQKKSILDKVATSQEKMQKWAHHAPMNFQHKYDLVEAEKARVLGQDLTAMDLYEKAIAGARKNEYLQEEALAYERAAEFYLARGMEKFAQTYLREAHHAYQCWGALAKVKDLEDSYPQLLTKKATTSLTSTRMTGTVQSRANATLMPTSIMPTMLATESALDLTTVMKASQAISSEIVLEALIKTFMQIVIENVGAEQGCLILRYTEGTEAHRGTQSIVRHTEGTEAHRETQSIVRYTEGTEVHRETQSIDEGAAGGLFLEAYATLENVEVLDSIPLESLDQRDELGPCLSQTIVTYTARTQTPQVLNDASHEGLFTNDPYIVQKRPQSVLCFPMIYKNQLTGLFYLENNKTTGAFTADRLAVLTMLSTQIVISLENAQYANHLEEKVKQRTAQLADANEEITALNEMLKEDNLRMGAELDVAKQLQKMVLPADSELTQIPNLDIAGFMEPADEVGGDYYDVLVHEGRVKIGIGDVTGHGLESGVLMLMVQTAVRALLDSGLSDVTQFLNTLNCTIYNNAQRMQTDKNLTLALLDYQSNTSTLSQKQVGGSLQITGQHEEVLVVRAGGCVEKIDTFELGFSVGVVDDIADFVSQKEVQLQPGDGIVLYTDGITEAQNLDKKLYGLERLCEVVSRNWEHSASEIQQAAIADVRQYIGTQKVFDDITLLVLKQK
ncbi:MAG: serine/threonine-protein kinase PknK [Candidatus Parabeggiatoa sp. nov. 1]|nr:MAG: serine/threonine-protein kinase PknK [Gammaproteobacteria bacterium]